MTIRVVFVFAANGGDEGIRTLDLSDANRTLSQLSYAPICGSAWNRTKYYNTDLGFVKENFPRQAVFLRKRIPASSAYNSAAGEKLPPAAEWIHYQACLLRIYSSMAFAAVFPAPIARMTVAAPVTASPPA